MKIKTIKLLKENIETIFATLDLIMGFLNMTQKYKNRIKYINWTSSKCKMFNDMIKNIKNKALNGRKNLQVIYLIMAFI